MLAAPLLAVQLLTRVPVRLSSPPTPRQSRWSAAFFPLVGAAIGYLASLVYEVLRLGFADPWVAIIGILISTTWITGALHEDGVADCADGFGSGADRERTLEIMSDSRIGAFGACALILLYLTEAALLSSLNIGMGKALVLTHTWSRWAPVVLGNLLRPAKSTGSGARFLANAGWIPAAIGLLICLAATWWALGWEQSYRILPAGLGAALFAWYCKRRLGGLTGDCLGAVVKVVEVLLLVGLATVSLELLDG